MDIVNKTVRHKTFGEGKVCEFKDNIISVRFGSTVKRFVFPDAFKEYLTLQEKTSRQYVDGVLDEIERDIQLKIEKDMREAEKKKLFRSLPLNTKSQAAFGFIDNDKQKAAKSWTVITGQYKSGYSCGKPRIPLRVYPNTACLLTYRRRNDREENRYIWGVFMAREDFIGSKSIDGIIPAHDKYRIKLDEDEIKKFLFWRYFVPESGNQSTKWGSTEIKYFSNIAMARILYDILRIRRGTDQQQLCEDFFDYFCQLNKIDKKQFPRSDGHTQTADKQ